MKHVPRKSDDEASVLVVAPCFLWLLEKFLRATAAHAFNARVAFYTVAEMAPQYFEPIRLQYAWGELDPIGPDAGVWRTRH